MGRTDSAADRVIELGAFCNRQNTNSMGIRCRRIFFHFTEKNWDTVGKLTIFFDLLYFGTRREKRFAALRMQHSDTAAASRTYYYFLPDDFAKQFTRNADHIRLGQFLRINVDAYYTETRTHTRNTNRSAYHIVNMARDTYEMDVNSPCTPPTRWSTELGKRDSSADWNYILPGRPYTVLPIFVGLDAVQKCSDPRQRWQF